MGRLLQVPADMPPALRDLVGACMSQDPAQRCAGTGLSKVSIGDSALHQELCSSLHQLCAHARCCVPACDACKVCGPCLLSQSACTSCKCMLCLLGSATVMRRVTCRQPLVALLVVTEALQAYWLFPCRDHTYCLSLFIFCRPVFTEVLDRIVALEAQLETEGTL